MIDRGSVAAAREAEHFRPAADGAALAEQPFVLLFGKPLDVLGLVVERLDQVAEVNKLGGGQGERSPPPRKSKEI